MSFLPPYMEAYINLEKNVFLMLWTVCGSIFKLIPSDMSKRSSFIQLL